MPNAKTLLDKLHEDRPSHIIDFFNGIKKVDGVEQVVELYASFDGMAALVRTEDGNAYEVTVRPAKYAAHGSLKKKVQPKSPEAFRRKRGKEAMKHRQSFWA